MNKILAISGRKQSGKDTCYKFLSKINPHTRHFYFADKLKRMCVDILGCPQEWVYGSDADKSNRLQHLLWENFPVEVWEYEDGKIGIGPVRYGEWGDEYHVKQRRKIGPMTVREVLQYWGTEVFRRAYPNVWADACIRDIKQIPQLFPDVLSVITDCRFPNEVGVTKDAGGKVIRLSMVRHPEDGHFSETALDPFNYDWNRFDHVIDNFSGEEGMKYSLWDLYEVLRLWEYIPSVPTLQVSQAIQETIREQGIL